jgi:hypothetical protein
VHIGVILAVERRGDRRTGRSWPAEATREFTVVDSGLQGANTVDCTRVEWSHSPDSGREGSRRNVDRDGDWVGYAARWDRQGKECSKLAYIEHTRAATHQTNDHTDRES